MRTRGRMVARTDVRRDRGPATPDLAAASSGSARAESMATPDGLVGRTAVAWERVCATVSRWLPVGRSEARGARA